MFANNNN